MFSTVAFGSTLSFSSQSAFWYHCADVLVVRFTIVWPVYDSVPEYDKVRNV